MFGGESDFWNGFGRCLALPLAAAVLASLTILGGHAPSPRSPHPEMERTETAQDSDILDLPGVVILDVRSEQDYRAGTIPDALHFDEANWDSSLGELLMHWEGGPVVVFCQDTRCGTGPRVAERLREALGTDEVYHLHGGFEGWNER